MVIQYTLGVRWRDDASFDNFIPGSNAFVLESLKRFLEGEGESQGIFLWGPSPSGCSHLLQACCQTLSDRPVAYFPLARPEIRPEMLEGAENLDLACFDDVDQVIGEPQWEHTLFNVYNRLNNSQCRFIFSAHQSPRHLTYRLGDLRSRLFSLLDLELKTLSDHQKLEALQLRARNRGLDLTQELASFLLHHYPRDIASLMDALQKLDDASLVEKRHLTIPFAKRVLNV